MTSPSLDTLNHPVIIIDTNLTIEYANQSWETLWRNFHNHSLVKSLKFYLNDQSVNSIRAEIDDYIINQNNPKPIRITTKIPYANNKCMECHISPINQEYRVAFICQFTLVASIKSEQERLLHELARLTTLNAIKSKFVNIVSHEFRTNLSIIQSSTEICRLLISEKPIKSNAKVEEHLNVITQEVDRITNLMGEILLITKIEAEHNNTQYEYFNIAKMLNEVLETHFRPWIDNRTISVSYQIRYTPNIVSNKLMITHIIKNLVENAFKYSPNRPSPKCRLKTTKNYWSFTILDYGIGINSAEYTSLGTQFFRASNVANIPGTGLGLTTVTYFLNILEAPYLIKSTLKKGTVFYLKFPKKKQHAENFN